MSTEEENKGIIRRWIDGLNEQTINDELLSKDYVYHVGGQEVKGAQTFKQSADATFFPVFPDVNYATDDMVENLSNIGTVVVAAAGNAENKPYIVGSPSSAKSAISVAQSTVPSAALFKIRRNTPVPPSPVPAGFA